jgi:hypothetical protein
MSQTKDMQGAAVLEYRADIFIGDDPLRTFRIIPVFGRGDFVYTVHVDGKPVEARPSYGGSTYFTLGGENFTKTFERFADFRSGNNHEDSLPVSESLKLHWSDATSEFDLLLDVDHASNVASVKGWTKGRFKDADAARSRTRLFLDHCISSARGMSASCFKVMDSLMVDVQLTEREHGIEFESHIFVNEPCVLKIVDMILPEGRGLIRVKLEKGNMSHVTDGNIPCDMLEKVKSLVWESSMRAKVANGMGISVLSSQTVCSVSDGTRNFVVKASSGNGYDCAIQVGSTGKTYRNTEMFHNACAAMTESLMCLPPGCIPLAHLGMQKFDPGLAGVKFLSVPSVTRS